MLARGWSWRRFGCQAEYLWEVVVVAVVRRWAWEGEDGLVGSSGLVMMLWKGHWADWRRRWPGGRRSAVEKGRESGLTLWWLVVVVSKVK